MNEDCKIIECPEDYIYCPQRKKKIQMAEDEDENAQVLLTWGSVVDPLDV